MGSKPKQSPDHIPKTLAHEVLYKVPKLQDERVLCHGSRDIFLTVAVSRWFPGTEQNTALIIKVLSTGNIALSVLNIFSLTNQLKLAGAKSERAAALTRWQATSVGANTTLHWDLLGRRAGNNAVLKRYRAQSVQTQVTALALRRVWKGQIWPYWALKKHFCRTDTDFGDSEPRNQQQQWQDMSRQDSAMEWCFVNISSFSTLMNPKEELVRGDDAKAFMNQLCYKPLGNRSQLSQLHDASLQAKYSLCCTEICHIFW